LESHHAACHRPSLGLHRPATLRFCPPRQECSKAQQLLALAVIHDGGARSEAARLGNVTIQAVRDWVLRFNDEGPLMPLAISSAR